MICPSPWQPERDMGSPQPMKTIVPFRPCCVLSELLPFPRLTTRWGNNSKVGAINNFNKTSRRTVSDNIYKKALLLICLSHPIKRGW